jgi:hypothetical protein
MKALALLITVVVLVPAANAEQGDAEDRAITAQMTKQMATPETQPIRTPSDAAYGDSGKASAKSDDSESKKQNNDGQ